MEIIFPKVIGEHYLEACDWWTLIIE
jgi:hypothetical protein